MRVRVTQQDITQGKRRSWQCPVALALQRATGRDVTVEHQTIWGDDGEEDRVAFWFSDADTGRRVEAPDVVKDFVVAFDENDPGTYYKPFTFHLDVPPVATRKGGS